MFKLAFYEYFADTRSYYREHRWMLPVTLVLIVFIPFFMLPTQNSGNPSYWLFFYGFTAFASADSEIVQHYPKIFSYVPLEAKKIKHYILYRTFMSGLAMSAFLLLLACGCTFISNFRQNFWFPICIILVLCREKMTFEKTYKLLNLSSYYSGMTIFGKVFNRIIRFFDLVTLVIFIVCYIPLNGSIQAMRADYQTYIISASIIYQCLSLIYFAFHVRISMKRLQLPELIEI